MVSHKNETMYEVCFFKQSWIICNFVIRRKPVFKSILQHNFRQYWAPWIRACMIKMVPAIWRPLHISQWINKLVRSSLKAYSQISQWFSRIHKATYVNSFIYNLQNLKSNVNFAHELPIKKLNKIRAVKFQIVTYFPILVYVIFSVIRIYTRS